MPLILLNNGKKAQLYKSDPGYVSQVNELINNGLLTADSAAQYLLPQGQIEANLAAGLTASGAISGKI